MGEDRGSLGGSLHAIPFFSGKGTYAENCMLSDSELDEKKYESPRALKHGACSPIRVRYDLRGNREECCSRKGFRTIRVPELRRREYVCFRRSSSSITGTELRNPVVRQAYFSPAKRPSSRLT